MLSKLDFPDFKDLNINVYKGHVSFSANGRVIFRVSCEHDIRDTGEIVKVKVIQAQKDAIERYTVSCEYSNKIVSMLKSKKYFKKYYVASSNSKDDLQNYFATEFTDEYVIFVDAIVAEFYSKLKKIKK